MDTPVCKQCDGVRYLPVNALDHQAGIVRPCEACNPKGELPCSWTYTGQNAQSPELCSMCRGAMNQHAAPLVSEEPKPAFRSAPWAKALLVSEEPKPGGIEITKEGHFQPAKSLLPVGTKHDTGKPRFDLMPPRAELAVIEVLEFGAQKYGVDNWRNVPEAEARYYSALRRHLNAWRAGEKKDPESTKTHLAHAACCIIFLLELEQTKE